MAAEIGKGVALGAATVAAVGRHGRCWRRCWWRSCPQPRQREQWKPEGQQHRLRRVRLGQRRQARQWVTSQPLLCRLVKGLRHLNRRRRPLLLRPQAQALKLLRPRSRRESISLQPRTLRGGPAMVRSSARQERTWIVPFNYANRQGGINSGRSNENSIALRPRPPGVG